MPTTKWSTTYTQYFALRMQLPPTPHAVTLFFHSGCGDALTEEVVSKGVLLHSELVSTSQAEYSYLHVLSLILFIQKRTALGSCFKLISLRVVTA